LIFIQPEYDIYGVRIPVPLNGNNIINRSGNNIINRSGNNNNRSGNNNNGIINNRSTKKVTTKMRMNTVLNWEILQV
jgi:hypothetical protein